MTLSQISSAIGAAFSGKSDQIRVLRQWDSQLRSPLGGVYKVGFASIDAGAGVTTIANQVLTTLIKHRPGPHLAVDLAQNHDENSQLPSRNPVKNLGRAPQNFAQMLGVTDPVEPSKSRQRARTSKEAVTGIPTGSNGSYVFRPAGDSTRITSWFDEIVPIVRFFDCVVADFGQCDPRKELLTAIRMCDAFCLVSGAHRRESEVAASLASGLKSVADLPPVSVALIDKSGQAPTGAELVAERSDIPAVVIPHDASLTPGEPARDPEVRLAVRHLTAQLLGAPSRGGEIS